MILGAVTIKIKGIWFEGKLAVNNFIIYLGVLLFPLLPLALWSPFTQSFSYLISDNYHVVQVELIEKSTSTFTFAQWMTYHVKLENGEIKRFDYLLPTKRAMPGDTITFKAGDRAGLFNDGIIITIDEIKKGVE